MTIEDKELIKTNFYNNRKGFYSWLFCNEKRDYLVQDLRKMFPEASSDLERAYWLIFDLTEAPSCPTCGKKITFRAAKARNINGYQTHCCHKCGVLDPHHQETIKNTKFLKYGDENYNNSTKTNETCKQKYGGNGIRGDREKAKQTMLSKYNVASYLVSPEINNMRNNATIQNKIQETKRVHKTFNTSKPENLYYNYLCNKYGKENVLRQYKDDRYPFNCDFYIKSEDLFIELNLFPTHGKEPFDENNILHIEYLERCKISPKNWIEAQIPLIWAGTDVLKWETAQKNKLNYLRIYNLEGIYNEKSDNKQNS